MFKEDCFIVGYNHASVIISNLLECGYKQLNENNRKPIQAYKNGTFEFTDKCIGIECDTDELFIAIASLSDETDEYQYYVAERSHYGFNGDDSWNYEKGEMVKYNNYCRDIFYEVLRPSKEIKDGECKYEYFHKATIDELKVYLGRYDYIFNDGNNRFHIITIDDEYIDDATTMYIIKNGENIYHRKCMRYYKTITALEMLCKLYLDEDYKHDKESFKKMINDILNKN